MISELNERFPNISKAVEAVVNALLHERHCILYGRGGHAKSEIVEAAIKLLHGEDYFYSEVKILPCSEDTDPANFLGYVDMVEFRERGNLLYKMDATIYEYEIAILEEGFDLAEYLLTTMRDPITRGKLCINKTCHPSKLKTLFVCTNVNPYLWAKTNSQKATLARFDMVVLNEWESYNVEDWDRMFKALKFTDYEAFSLFGERDNKDRNGMSPRDMVKMYKIYKEIGFQALSSFNGMTPERFEMLENAFKLQPYLSTLKELIELKGKIMNDFENNAAPNVILAKVNRVKDLLDSVNQLPMNGEYTDDIANIAVSVKWWETEILKRIAKNPLTL